MVLMGLARSGCALDRPVSTKAICRATAHASTARTLLNGTLLLSRGRGIDWLLGMQNSDGGWAAFDRDINHQILEKVPFADLQGDARSELPRHHRPGTGVARPVRLPARQSARRPGPRVPGADAGSTRGCFIGRWGVNYLYGTWQVLQGLEAIGFDRDHPMVHRAVAWLMDVQQISRRLGRELPHLRRSVDRGPGPVTASQTAWALLGLIAAGEAQSDAVGAGVWFLVERRWRRRQLG